MYSHKLYKPSAFLDNLSQLYPRCFEKRILNLFSCFFISSIILFSFQPIADSYGAFCKAVKYKDDGRNDYNIYIGTSQFGIADCIIGTNHKDIILGGDGQDYIKGKGGDDNLQGRFDNDQIRGNDDDDNIQGGPGNDYVYGNDGNDVLFAGFDSDFLSGGNGNDELYGDFGEDMLEGGRGADYFDCGENYDIVLDYDPGDGDILANNCEEVIRS
jgi:hypothetical protein